MSDLPSFMPKRRELLDICADVRSLVAPQVKLLQEHSWFGSTESQVLEFVKRAAVVRQFEAAEAILALVNIDHGAFGVTMLRPAYEELLWIQYLRKHEDICLELVQLLTKKEILDSYQAQKEYLGQKGIRQIGFTSRLSKRIEKGLRDPSTQLKKIGATLGWRNGSTQPTMAFVARAVGREKQYRYLYQGTSRSVHFSPHELQRRVWGQHGSVKIASSNFDRYWSDFALSWSFRILIETLIHADFTSELETDVNSKRMSDLIQELRPVQILTATELEAWDEPSPELQRKN